MDAKTKKSLNERILDAEVRCSHWLAEGNQAKESGDAEKAEMLYAKSQYWLDRRNRLEERRWTEMANAS